MKTSQQFAAWQQLAGELQSFVEAKSPQSVLVVQQSQLEVLTNLDDSRTRRYKRWRDYLNQASGSDQYELAVVVCDQQSCDDERFSHLIARLRDVDCAQLLLACSIDSALLEERYDTYFRALGFKRLRAYVSQKKNQPSAYLYYFNLYDYKETPDWLNERFWANPEMWDKARW